MVAAKRSIKALPPIPRDATPEMRQLLTALAENARILGNQGKGSQLDAAVTFRDIGGVSAGRTLTALIDEYSAVGGLNNDIAPDTPTAPTGVVISASDTAVVIGWDSPSFTGYWYTQVYRTTWDGSNLVGFDEAFAVAQTAGVFMDLTVSQNADYIYWLRHVNTAGAKSPLSSSAGHTVKTLESLDYKKGWITQDRLEADLQDRIDLIDTATLFGTDGGLLGLFENDLSVLGQLKQETIDAQIAAVDAAALAEAEQLEASAAALAARNDALATAADVIEAAASKDAAALSATNASGSAAAAAVAKTDAAGSATAALAAKNDAASSKTAAAASATAAAGSASAALSAKTAAEGSASSAAAFADAAEGSADAALSAQTTAEGAASLAVASATASEDSAAAALVAKNTAESEADAAATSATSASTSATAAANSASAALTAKNNAATSATNAATSANTATTKASSATASATAAADSASAALVSKNSAATSETNAAGSKTAAASSASSAAASATSAAGSATAAISAKNSAATSETNAATSATTATNKASAASASATAAAGSASAALTAQNSASSSATAADGSKTSAASSASSATASATAAAGSASAALASKNAAVTSATAADGSKTSAATSAAAALAASTAADGSASAALASKTAAATSASNASGSAATATSKAAEAVISAQTALDKATLAQQVALRLHNIDNTNNLVDTGEWVIGTSGSQSGAWLQNGGTSENAIVAGQGPYGSTALWQCTSDGVNDGSGGFSRTFTVNPAKTYRYVLWFKKPSGSGSYYFGCSQYTTETLAGAFNSNPYFTAGGRPSAVPSDSWFCIVGYVYAAGTTVDSYTDSGIYTADGQRIGGVTNYRIKAGSTTQLIRAYQFYSTTLGAQQWMCEPRVEEVSSAVPLSTLFGSLAAVQARMTATENEAYYSLKVQANGKVAGFGLTATPNGTAILFNADQFGVTNGTGSDSIIPFSVKDGLVYINDARIGQIQANKIFNVGSVDSPDAGMAHLGNTFVEGAFTMGKMGQIRMEYLDPSFRDRLVMTDPNATVTGGTRAKSTTPAAATTMYACRLTGTPANGDAPIPSGGATTTITLSVLGGITHPRNAAVTTYAPSCRVIIYRKKTGGSNEVLDNFTYTGTAVNIVVGGEPTEHRSRIDISRTFVTPAPTSGVNYEYWCVISNVTGSWALDANGAITAGGTITLSVSETIGSSGGVLVESLAYKGQQYLTVNDGGVGRGASVVAGDMYVANFGRLIANSSGQLFDTGNRVYSDNNKGNIGTGATNYAAGNHTHNYLPFGGGSLTGALTLNYAAPVLNLVDSDSYGAAIAAWISFRDAGGVERAYVGYGSSGNTDFYITNTLGDVHVPYSLKVSGLAGFSGRAYGIGDGNLYHQAGFETRGNGTANTVFPSIGFHQPGLYAATLRCTSGSSFGFYQQDGVSLATVNASTFVGSLNGTASNSNGLGGLGVGSFIQTNSSLPVHTWIASPGHDANTTKNSCLGFTYSNNAPHTGPLVTLGSGAYVMQFNSRYGDGNALSWRGHNGDNQTWGAWRDIYHTGNKPTSADVGALAAGGTAVNSNALGGLGVGSFMRTDADDSFSGRHISTSRNGGIVGTYDPYKTDQIWSMGAEFRNAADGSNFGNLYGFAYKHVYNATGGTMAGGHQAVWCTNGAARAAIGESGFWTSGTTYSNAFRGVGNVAGTGEAIYTPAGIYSTGTNRLYGAIITNNNNINAGTGTVTCGLLDASSGARIAIGRNLEWGAAYSAGAPTIACSGNGSTGAMYLYPSGNVYGAIVKFNGNSSKTTDFYGTVYAPTFVGALSGTADVAKDLTSDASWQTINLNRDPGTGRLDFQHFSTSSTNRPAVASNANGLISMGTHAGGYVSQLAFSSNNSLYHRAQTAGAWAGWKRVLDQANYNSYTPTLTGTGASGTWGISVSGNASSASQLAHSPSRTDTAEYPILWGVANGTTQAYSCANVTIQSSSGRVRATEFRGRNVAGTGDAIYCPAGIYATTRAWLECPITTANNYIDAGTGSITGGVIYANGGLVQDGNVVLNGSDTWLRTTGATGWYSETYGGGWHMTDSTWIRTYASKRLYATAVAVDSIMVGGGILLGAGSVSNTGYGITGVYTATAFQGVFSMGAAYQLPANGSSSGNLYGIAWTHSYNTNPNGRKISGHHAVFMSNGVTGSAIGDSIWTKGTVTGTDCISTSDRRVKDNLVPIRDAVAKVEHLHGYTFDRKDMEGRRHAGLIAQDVRAVLPEAIFGTKDHLQLSSSAVIGLLVESIKELSSRIRRLEAI